MNTGEWVRSGSHCSNRGSPGRVRTGGRPDGEVRAVQRVRRAVAAGALPMAALVVAVLAGRSCSGSASLSTSPVTTQLAST
jgi:hypothetical protein